MTAVTLWVDAISPRPGGIGRYVSQLAHALPQHEGLEVKFYAHNRRINDPSILSDASAQLPRRNRLERWWDVRAMKRSLVHGPNYFLPAFADTGIITIHDLSVFRYPETHPAERVKAFEREFLSSLRRAAHIITDTDAIRREVIEMFAVRPDSVTSVPLGVDERFSPMPSNQLASSLAAWDLTPGSYGLCVSTLEPRKKIAELLAAWRMLPSQVRRSYPLVLAGGEGWRNESLRALIEAGVAEGWLRHLGFVDEISLPALYAGAALFLYPSNYEGFGLPPLEAMASGTPVIVSSSSCLPEVCGDAARYIDPDDIEDFTAVIESTLEDADWRAAAAKRGIIQAARFNWPRCVDKTVELYHRISGTGGTNC